MMQAALDLCTSASLHEEARHGFIAECDVAGDDAPQSTERLPVETDFVLCELPASQRMIDTGAAECQIWPMQVIGWHEAC